MPGERRIGICSALGPIAPRLLAIQRITQHRGKGIAASITQIEKMPGHHAASAGLKLAAAAESLSMNSSMWLSSMTSGGKTRMVLSPAETVSN